MAALGSRGVLQNARLMIASFYYATRCIWRAFCKDSASESRAELVRAMPSAAYLIKNAPTCLLIKHSPQSYVFFTRFLRLGVVSVTSKRCKEHRPSRRTAIFPFCGLYAENLKANFRAAENIELVKIRATDQVAINIIEHVSCIFVKFVGHKNQRIFMLPALPSRAETACKCASYTHFFYPEKPFSLSVLMLFNCNLAI